MADPRLTDYIRKATEYGYSREQIKEVLVREGWDESEIDEAFRESGTGTENMVSAGDVSAISGGKSIGFITSILSGLLIILDGVMLRTSYLIGFTVIEIIDPSMTIELIMLSLIFGLGVILGSVLIYKGKNMVGGVLVILMSFISMITFIGLIIGLIGIVAGILGILKK